MSRNSLSRGGDPQRRMHARLLPAAQRQEPSGKADGEAQSLLLAHTPRMVAQRKAIGALFGSAAQRILDGREEPAGQTRRPGTAGAHAGGTGARTGLPEGLKAGVEALSGIDLSDVQVHHNSRQPAQLNALAYAQGSDIHVGPGQERHLPHEAWHMVQQRQGRVRPNMQLAGVAVNDEVGLEAEADAMGARASQFRGGGSPADPVQRVTAGSVAQLKWVDNGNGTYTEDDTGENFNSKTRSYTGGKYNDWSPEILSEVQAQEVINAIRADLANVQPEVVEDEPAPDPYAEAAVLSNGTTVDWPALTRVMDGVEIGTEVGPNVWRAMRAALSYAITLANKSHPAHGSNFNKPQRPEQQIRDWASPIQGPLRIALTAYFASRHQIDI